LLHLRHFFPIVKRAISYEIASIYAALDNVDETFVWLERAFEDRSTLIGWLPWDEAFDGVRSDPRYPPLVRRLNLH
jgi:hypothetical protein